MRTSSPQEVGPNYPARHFRWPRVYGYDFFISFKLGAAPTGAQSYCSDLARRLRELDFTVFYSEEEAPPGAALDTTLRKALGRSRILVVVLNEAAILVSEWVPKEVQEFRRRHPRRLVIPIEVAGAIQQHDQDGKVSAWLGQRGRIWLNETQKALDDGIASADVVRRLQVSHRFLRANTLLRWTAAAMALALLGLTLWANYEAWDAKRKFRQGTALRLAAEGLAMASGSKAGGAVRGLLQILAAHRLSPSADTDTALHAAFLEFRSQAFIREVDNAVMSLAFDVDGGALVGGSYNGTLRRWDGNQAWKPGAEGSMAGPVSTIAFASPSGQIVSGNLQGDLRVWNAKTFSAVALPGPPPRPLFIWSVAVSADGSHFAWGTEQGGVEAWNVSTGRSLTSFTPAKPQTGAPIGIAFSRDNRWVGFYTNIGMLGVFDVSQPVPGAGHRSWMADTGAGLAATNTMAGNYEVPSGVVAFSPDGARLVSGSSTGALQLWNAADGNASGSPMDAHPGGVTGVAYSVDGKRIYSIGNDAALRIWEALPLKRVTGFASAHTAPITAMAVHPRGAGLATAGLDNTLRIWTSLDEALPVAGPESAFIDEAKSVAFDSKGNPVVSGARIQSALQTARVMARSPSGTREVMHNADASLTLWDSVARRPIVPLATAPGDRAASVNHVLFSPEGSFLLSLDDPDQILRWDATSGRPLPPLAGAGAQTSSITVTRDGRIVATGSRDGSVRIWDLASGKAAPAMTRLSGDAVTALALSPDGRRVVTATPDGLLQVWDRGTGKPMLAPLRGHQATVGSVAFSPDGQYIVSGGGAPFSQSGEHARLDYAIRLWNADSGRAIGTALGGHTSAIAAIAFSADAKRIVSTASDGKLRVWQVFAAWSDALCAKLPRNPSVKEWEDWVSPDIAYLCPCPGLPNHETSTLAACRR